MKKKRKIIAIFIILFLIVAICAFCVLYINSCLKPSKEFLNGSLSNKDGVVVFNVDEGAYGKSTINKLEEENIIKDSTIVYYFNKFLWKYSFYQGSYEIPLVNDKGETIKTKEILAFLNNPSNAKDDAITITFDEGDFLRSFAEKLGDNLDITTDELVAYWQDENVIQDYIDEYPFLTDDILSEDCKYYLEGYLFPDTYEFSINSSADTITRKFLDRTLEIYNKYIDLFEYNDYSIHEIFTLSSIIQWESGNPEDSKLIAGVFINRLNEPEVLGSTVTACYAFDLNKDDCHYYGDSTEYTHTYNPYNTYTIQGLPPGPVCNPNENAIIAALSPTESDYFYFCADMCNGGTVFAETYDEHQYNIDTYYLPCDE